MRGARSPAGRARAGSAGGSPRPGARGARRRAWMLDGRMLRAMLARGVDARAMMMMRDRAA